MLSYVMAMRPVVRANVCMGVSVLVIFWFFIANAIEASRDVDEGSPLYDSGFAWVALATLGTLVPVLRLWYFLSKAGWIISAVDSTHTITVWAQLWITAAVGVYTAGPQFSSVDGVLTLLPILGTLLEVPMALSITLVALTTIMYLLLDIHRAIPEAGLVRFQADNAYQSRTGSFLSVCAFAWAMGAGYMYRLRDLKWQKDQQSRFIAAFLGHITELATDRAEDRLLEYEDLMMPTGEDANLVNAARDCIIALSRLRPYLPAAMMVGDGMLADFDDDDALRDEDDEMTDDDGEGPFAMRHEASGMRQSFDAGNNNNRDDDDDPTTTTVLRQRTCSILHVEMIEVLDAPSAAESSRRAAQFAAIVVEQIQRNDGVVDVMSPWAITASFNGQTPCPRHAKRACSAALGISARLARAFIAVDTRANLAGVCGVDRLRARVVCGDGVELARKLPRLGRYLRTNVIITENVHLEVAAQFDALPVDVVRPAMLTEETDVDVTLYELRARKGTQGLDAYVDAFNYLREGNKNEGLRMISLYHDLNQRRDYNSTRILCILNRLPDNVVDFMFARREMQWAVLRGEEDLDRMTVDDMTEQASAHGGQQGAAEDENFSAVVSKLVPDPSTQQAAAYVDDEGAGGGLISMFDFGASGSGNDESSPNVPGGVEEPGTRVLIEPPEEDDDRLPNSFQDDVLLERWILSRRSLGTGAFSSVFLGMSLEGLLVAMKCVNLKARQTDKVSLSNEVVRMRKLQHHNVVSYISCANIGRAHFIIVMEYVSGGSLHHVIDTFGPPPLPAVRKYVTDLLRGLKYLHDNGIIHCDIKPHNALLTPDGSVKLSDFGSSVNVTLYGQTGDEELLVRGTSWYLAPEACRNEITAAVDIWSVGITVLQLLTGKIPWEYRGSEANFIRELGKNPEMKPMIPVDIPSNAAAFCKMCLRRDPADRPTADALLRTPFLTG